MRLPRAQPVLFRTAIADTGVTRQISVDELAGRLPALLGEWRRLTNEGTLQSRLPRLLERLSPLLPSRSVGLLSANRLESLLAELSTALAQGRSIGDLVNPWTVAGVGRREVRNAAILATLWSRPQVGDVGPDFLAGFFDRCATSLLPSLPDREELAFGYRVRVENCPGVDGADRVDLVIETLRHLVGIEVKIDAGEGPEQLRRYVEVIGRSARQLGKQPRVVLLAPFAPSRDDVISANWSMVRSAAAAALPRRRSEFDFAHHLVAHFTRHVRSF